MTDAKEKTRTKIKPQKEARIMDDIRAGLLSLPKIAAKHKVPYHHVYRISKSVGVTGDLRSEVMAEARSQAVALRMGSNEHDGVIVSENAQAVLAVVRDHSDGLRRARKLASVLMDDLENTIRNRDEIERAIEIETANDQTAMREVQMKRAVSLPVNAKTLVDIANAMKTVITLEREIFKIGQDDGDKGRESLEDYLLSLPGEATRMPG